MWIKRRWRCVDADCDAKTWTGHSDHVDAQAVLTRRAGAEACRQVGEEARPVLKVAAELGVCWCSVMNAVIEHGTPSVDDPKRISAVTQLGLDETSFLRANRHHATIRCRPACCRTVGLMPKRPSTRSRSSEPGWPSCASTPGVIPVPAYLPGAQPRL